MQLAERSVNATNEGGNPGSMLVDFFPICELSSGTVTDPTTAADRPHNSSETHSNVDAWRGFQEDRVASTYVPRRVASRRREDGQRGDGTCAAA